MAEQEAGNTTVVFEGELDLAKADEISERIVKGGHGADVVMLDLSAVTFFDSSALRAVFVAQRLLASANVSLTIGPVSRIVDRVLTLAGVWDVFRRPAN